MTSRYVYADADRASWRTQERRRLADLEFLEKLRTADLAELYRMHDNHRSKRAPAWKKVAIARAIARRMKER